MNKRKLPNWIIQGKKLEYLNSKEVIVPKKKVDILLFFLVISSICICVGLLFMAPKIALDSIIFGVMGMVIFKLIRIFSNE